ncbi:MAG: cytochrome-c oxidase, cbb3-type subunit III [Alteromonadaceae bacterium]|nr:MAG: cytochrome-c oxidase, cbb3-type subunit III [Alteromonadaceae bacterium]
MKCASLAQKAQAKFAETYDVYMKLPVEELVYNPQALEMGVRIFSNNCALCHGSDGGGNVGIPDLSDKDWLYGGSPEQIRHSIEHGRSGNMPPWGDILGSDNISAIGEYVLKLSGQKHDATLAANGEGLFAQNCSACHGETGEGMYVLGAPNLTDDIWLHGGEKNDILRAVWYGFNTSNMPAHKELLREHKLHLLTAYVYSLSYDYE